MNNKIATEEELEIEIKPYAYYEQQFAQKTHHYYLSGYIESPAAYVDMIHKIRTAGLDEIIIIHLNTPGGDLSTGVQLINAIKYSDAHVICSLEGEACSLGSLIFLAGDEFLTHDNSIMMIHNYSGGTYGKGNEQVLELAATIKWFNSLAHSYYVPFISEDELVSVLKGEDLWLQSDDIRKRLVRMVKIMQKDATALEKRAKKKSPAKK